MNGIRITQGMHPCQIAYIDEKELFYANFLRENSTWRNSFLHTNVFDILKKKASYPFMEMNIDTFLVQSQLKLYAVDL